ncbi:MAG: polyprenyl synthetase family protein [Candidatus Syntropharchaeia archaeon]
MKFFEEYKKLVDESYPKYFDGRKPELQYKPLKEFIERGGKRLRPILCLLSCEFFGGKKEDALPTAVALEFFHNFTLIHDDIEDNSLLRRGEPTLHIKYGIPLAINAGDGLHALSYGILRENRKILGIERAWRIFEIFNEMNIELVEGQSMDIEFKMDRRMDEETFIELIRKKTSALFSASARCGAIAGGAKENDVEKIGKVWEYVGIAFQIQDDILDVIGKEEKFGKKIGEDISEGKPTLLLIHCLKKCKNEERKKIEEAMDSEYDEKTVREVIDLFKRYGCIEYARGKASSYLKKAMELLDSFPDGEEKEKMRQMAEYFVSREV